MNSWLVLALGLALMAIGALSPFGGFGALFLVAGVIVMTTAARDIFRRK